MPYDSSLLATSSLQQVRFLLGGAAVDTLVLDAEISFSLGVENNVYTAAALCAENRAAAGTPFAFTHSVGPLAHDGKTARDAWLELAASLRRRGKLSTGLTADAMLVGVSTADQQAQDEQTEYPQFFFKTGAMDHPGTSTE